MRRAEIAMDTLLHVVALLRANHENFLAVKSGHAAENRRIISESAVTMNLAPVGEHALNVVQRLRTLRMPGQLSLLPRRGCGFDLLSQGVDALLQPRQLAASGIILVRVFHLRQ